MVVQTGPAQLPLRPLATHESPWAPDAVACAMNARLDARLVPSETAPGGLRVDYAHVVVLDNFLGEELACSQVLKHCCSAVSWTQILPVGRPHVSMNAGAGYCKEGCVGQDALEMAVWQLSATAYEGSDPKHARMQLGCLNSPLFVHLGMG